MNRLIFLMLVGALGTIGLAGTQSRAAEIEGVKFEDKITLDGKELVLNGVGLRTVTRFGIRVKVYVMGLYLSKKDGDAGSILKSDGPKYLKMVFLRHVDSKTIRDGWRTGFNNNCESDCELARPKLSEFNDLMSDMKDQKSISLFVQKDKTTVDVKGHKEKAGTISGVEFARAIPKIWLGSKPPNEELKTGLLGKK